MTGITANMFAAGLNTARAGSPLDTLAGQIAVGIFASFAKPLGCGPFAQAMLPTLLMFQGCRCPQGGGQGATPQPVDNAQWTATLQGGGKGAIDLGDGYTLDLNEHNSEITIHNAKTGETTQIWGDPHVNVDGKHAFDFWGTTTFQLENGTKITIDTEQFAGNPDMYVASGVTITKGDQALQVKGISQNEIGDLSITQSNNGRSIDDRTRDGFVLHENATGSGWRSEFTGQIATQEDLNATKVGELYGPGSTMPSLGEVSELLSAFLLLGALGALADDLGGGRAGRH
jgi:Domain of Unknown Function (DUF1521)